MRSEPPRGLQPLGAQAPHDLLEIVEERYGRRSTIVTSQPPAERWHDLIGDPTYADAILDRLVHNAHRIDLAGESVRKTRRAARRIDRNQNRRQILTASEAPRPGRDHLGMMGEMKSESRAASNRNRWATSSECAGDQSRSAEADLLEGQRRHVASRVGTPSCRLEPDNMAVRPLCLLSRRSGISQSPPESLLCSQIGKSRRSGNQRSREAPIATAVRLQRGGCGKFVIMANR